MSRRTFVHETWASTLVLVVAAPPGARLVASFGGSVKPLIHAPERVHAAGKSRICVIDRAVLERERAHARSLARVRCGIGPAHRSEGLGALATASLRRLAHVVVFKTALALLLLAEPDIEVGVEVAAERGRPGKRPPHPLLVRLQLC